MEQLELFDQSVPADIDRLTFNQAMRLFTALHWGATKMALRTEALSRYLVAYFEGRYLETIGRQDVIGLRHILQAKRGLGISSINKAHRILKLLYNKMEHWKSDGWAGGYNFSKLQLPHKNPAALVPVPKDPARDRFITPWEFRKMISIAKRLNDWDLVDIIKMGIWLRLSPIDLENLNDDEINDDRFQIEVYRRHTKTAKNPQGILQVVPLKEKIWGLINRRRQYRGPNDKLILNFRNIRRRLARVRKCAIAEGMKDFKIMDLRRAGSGFLYNAGVDIQTISEGLGQTTTKVTYHHYIPKTKPHLRKSTEILVDTFDS